MIQVKQQMTTQMTGFDSNDLLLSGSLIDCPIVTAVA